MFILLQRKEKRRLEIIDTEKTMSISNMNAQEIKDNKVRLNNVWKNVMSILLISLF